MPAIGRSKFNKPIPQLSVQQNFQSVESSNHDLTELTLPDERKERKTNFWDFTWLIYGEKKIGKTSLANAIDGNFILAFEPGDSALESMSRPVPTWEHFIKYVDLLERNPHKYKCVTIDTATVLYDLAMIYACAKHNMKHPGANKDYGASWKLVENEFKLPLLKLFSLPIGKIIIAHSTVREIETLSGLKVNTIQPLLSSQAESFLTAIIDNIAYYRYIKNDRFLTISGNELISAGTRCKYNFFTPDGERVCNIPMGSSEEEGLENMILAFDNKQEDSYQSLNLIK